MRLMFRAALLLAGAIAAGRVLASDKSSSRPNVISVPSGPGSVGGLGERFEAGLASGGARQVVPIELPPGTAGFAPSVALTYDSGSGNGVVGVGWSLGLSTIQYQTEKGLPRYDGHDRLVLDGAELVDLGAGVLRCKLESRYVRVRRSSPGFEVDEPDGRTLRYGFDPGSRVVSGDGARVFAWALEDAVDRSGNRISYLYARDAGQLYVTQILYNRRAGAADVRVEFEYEGRPDPVTDCKPGFCVTTGRRLRSIAVRSRGQLVRRYRLEYAAAAGLSTLVAVVEAGSDDATALPALRLGYSGAGAPTGARAMQSAPGYQPGPGRPDDELVDVDGDGFPDLLHAETGRHWWYPNQGGLRFGAAQPLPVAGSQGSPSLALSGTGVEIADLDGDGLPDLLSAVGLAGSDWTFFPNRGVGRWEAPISSSRHPSFRLDDPTVRFLDVDGDHLPDLVQTTGAELVIWRNRGDGSWDGPTTVPAPLGLPAAGFSDPRVKLADLNGDRLLDLVYVLDGSITWWPNLGWGSFGAPVSIANAPATNAPAAGDLFLADVTGDGLADLVRVGTSQVDVWPLRPDGGFADPISFASTPAYDRSVTVVRLADMNGNGTLDVVWSTPSADADHRVLYLDLVGDLRPNLLVSVDNGLGKHVELRYTSSGAEYQAARESGQPWATRVPFPVQVVASVTSSDGLGHHRSIGYAYREGWYAPETREFRGFAQVDRLDPGDDVEAAARLMRRFDLGRSAEVLKGHIVVEETRTGDGRLLRRETTTFAPRALATGLDGTQVTSAERSRLEVEHWEAAATPATTREEWTYDAFGDVLVHSEWGLVTGGDPLAGGDERITTSSYASDEGRWMLGRNVRVTVADAAGHVVSDERTYYDGEPFQGLALGTLGDRGLATRTERWVEGDRWIQSERLQRDGFGVVTARLDGLGRRTEIEYDPDTHVLPVAERAVDASGRALSTIATYDVAQGLLLSVRDPAGRQSRFGWDALHRLTRLVKPGDSDDLPTFAFEYVLASPRSFVETQSRVEMGAHRTLTRRAWYDGLGRQLGVVEQAEGGRTVTHDRKDYAISGAVRAVFEPTFGAGYELTAADGPATRSQYDALGRATRTVHPDGSTSELRYAPLAVEHWDAEDLDPSSPHAATPRIERTNGLGLAQVEERLGARSLVTRIARDALGQVAAVIDPLGHAVSWRRDGAGRVVEVRDPDTGTTTYAYDDAGQLRKQVDARGAIVQTEYDDFARPAMEQLFDAQGAQEERVAYHYDAPSPVFGDGAATGDLAWVEDGAGEEHLRRDARGRIVETVRKVDARSYRTARTYDDLDRVTSRTFSDGTTLAYRQGERGLLQEIPGLVDAFDYDPQGRVTRRAHSNGTAWTALYDPMGRVIGIATARAGTKPQDLALAYDRAGNWHMTTCTG